MTLAPDALAAWRQEHGATELSTDTKLIRAVQAIIDDVNAEVSKAESIRRFRILLAAFSVNDELTPTQKVRRGHVLTKYAAEVTALYPDEAAR